MGRKIPEVALFALLVCGCRNEPPPPPASVAIVLSTASKRALAEQAAPVTVTVDLAGVADEDAGRITALLDAFAREGKLSWRTGDGLAAGLTLRSGSGERAEHLAVPVQTGRIDTTEIEAGLVTRLLRLAHGRKRIGVTVGHGEDGWDGLADPEVGLAADYELVRVEWHRPERVDALIIDGPRGKLPGPALAAVRGLGLPILYLVDDTVDPELLAPIAFRVVPGALVDTVNGSPTWRDGGMVLSSAPLAQVLAGAPGDPLAHLSYVAMPLAVALLAPDAARPILRTSPQTQGGARIVGYALETHEGTRLAVVGSAALVGAARLALHRRLGTEVTAGGFHAVSRLVDWLVSDVDVVNVHGDVHGDVR